jgi:REP-associated tyrosine transposase
MPHTFTNLRYHLVFTTKHRKAVIGPEVRDDLYRYIGGIIRRERGLLLEIGGVADHVHILAGFMPRLSLSEAMQKIKGSSSRWWNEQSLTPDPFAWQNGYSAFTVSESQVAKVRRYIQRQEEHHQRVSYQDELQELLRRHGLKG